MQYITEPINNAYQWIYSYFYSVPQEYDCNPDEAQMKLNVLIMEIQQHIQLKQLKLKKELDELQENFSKHIHSEEYQEQRRLDFCRLIANKKNDLNIFTAINHQVEKIKQFKTQLVTMRKNQEYLVQIMPTIENLILAASYDNSLQINLFKFKKFIEYLWGKEYIISEQNNCVDVEFRNILTKIPVEEDFEQACLEFSAISLVHPQVIYRCNEEKSRIYSEQSSLQSKSNESQVQLNLQLN